MRLRSLFDVYKVSVLANIGTCGRILNWTDAAKSVVLVDFLIDTKGNAGTH